MNGDFIGKLKPIRSGMSVREVVTAERIGALQDGVKALWERENLRSPVKAVENKNGDRFVPCFAHGKLRIGLGTVGVGQMESDRIIDPYYPLFLGARINAEIAPAKAIDSLSAGRYKITVRFCFTDGVVEITPEEEVVEKLDDEWVVLVATFESLGDGGVKDVDHLWRSDIMICCGDTSCAGSESDGSSDSGGGSSHYSSGDSSDSSSGGSSSGDPDECCPTLIVAANVYSVGSGYMNDCFTSYTGTENVEIGVVVDVIGNPCHCRNSFVRIQVGGSTPQYFNLGFQGDGTVSGWFNVQASPCQDLTVTACWMTSVGIAGGAGTPLECQSLVCCESIVIRMPEVCGDTCDSSGGSSDSGGGSSDSGGGSSGSGSGDPGSEKTAIVPSVHSSKGYFGMMCMEATQALFVRFVVLKISQRVQMHAISLAFASLCEPGSIFVAGAHDENGEKVKARVIGLSGLETRCSWLPWKRPRVVRVQLVGVRRGHDYDLPEKTREQFERNERFLKMPL